MGVKYKLQDDELKQRRRQRQGKRKQVKQVKISKTTTLLVDHAFLYISLPSLHDYDVELLSFTFSVGRKQTQDNDSLFIIIIILNLDTVFYNSTSEKLTNIRWQIERRGIL